MTGSTDFAALRCPACGAPLGATTLEAAGSERSPWGDEYSDELHRCAGCGAWAVVTVVDRFSGPEETKVYGPMAAEEVEERREAMKGR